MVFPAAVLVVISIAISLPAQAREASGEAVVEECGSLVLPREVHDADGRAVPVVGLSGVSWIDDDHYVAVMDNSRTVLAFRLEMSPAGKPLGLSDFTIRSIDEQHDYEDIVWLPVPAGADEQPQAGVAGSGRVLVCEEDSPGIHAFDLASGRKLASLAVPGIFRSRRPNRGLESLAVDAGGRHVWTANEEPLEIDGPSVTADAAGVVRLARVPIARGEPGVAASAIQHAYPVDPPHRFVKVLDAPLHSGVTAIVCTGPERLLVLERSGGPGLPPFESRLYEVSLDGAEDVSGVRERLGEKESARLAKRLVWKGQIGINLEGLCLGPRLAPAGRAVVGIGDNGGLDTPSRLVVFRLTKRG